MKLKTQRHSKENYSDIGLTPIKTYELLNEEFNFELDPATEENNPLGTKNFFTEKDDAFTKKGNGNVFLNPPYSNIGEGIKKALDEYQRDNNRVIVMLIPARTDTKYFHNGVVPYAEVRFIKGRIKFSEKGSAPFPSMLVIYGKKPNIKTQLKESTGNQHGKTNQN